MKPLRETGNPKRTGERGAITLAALGALVITLGKVLAIAGMVHQGGRLGHSWGQTMNLLANTDRIAQHMKGVYRTAHERGAITHAQLKLVEVKIDQTAHLWRRVGEKMAEKQVDVYAGVGKRTAAFFAAHVVFATQWWKSYVAKGTAFAGGAVSKGMVSDKPWNPTPVVDAKDLADVLAPVRKEWERQDDKLQQALAATRIRFFLDRVEGVKLPRKRRIELARQFVRNLERDNWKLPGVKNRKDLKQYVIAEIKKYRGEAVEGPQLKVRSFIAEPNRVLPAQNVELRADLATTGFSKGTASAAFEIGGQKIPARVNVVGRLDTLITASAIYDVPQEARPGERTVTLRAQASGPELRENWGLDEVEASGQTTFEILAHSDYSELERWYRDKVQKIAEMNQAYCCRNRQCNKQACKQKVEIPCRDPEKLACCRIEKQKAGEDRWQRVCVDCGCIPPSGLGLYTGTFLSPYWFDLDPEFIGCFRDVLKEYVHQYDQILDAWALKPQGQADAWASDKLQAIVDKADAQTRSCKQKACETKCAPQGKEPVIGGMFTEQCECR